MSYIKTVIPKDDYKLEVLLDNGNVIILCFEDRLNTLRFSPLRNKDLFSQATTNGSFIQWQMQIEISIAEVFEWVQK